MTAAAAPPRRLAIFASGGGSNAAAIIGYFQSLGELSPLIPSLVLSNRAEMGDCVVTIGFSKSKESLDAGFERYKRISYTVRKTRMLGSAALAMAYIACGRLDAYVEEQISLWDIAAGQLLIEAAGGKVRTAPGVRPGTMFICASNGKVPIEDYV